MIHRLVALLTAFLPDSIIVFMAHITGKSKLTAAEKRVQEEYIAHLGIGLTKSARSGKIVAMVGLIGSGKSRIAQGLAKEFPAIIIEGDAVRVCLREAGASYDRAWKICENAAIAVTESGAHVVIDADYFAAEKRASLNKAAKKAGVDMVYLRTFCDFDMMIGRMMAASYPEDSFFGGASTQWQGTADQRGAVVKLREMMSRLPSYFQAVRTKYPGRYKWVPRKFSFVDFTVDTTNEKKCSEEVKKIAKRIRLR